LVEHLGKAALFGGLSISADGALLRLRASGGFRTPAVALFMIKSNAISGAANNTNDLSRAVDLGELGLGFAGMGLLGLTRRRKNSHYAF
jgi:hypothetical protein